MIAVLLCGVCISGAARAENVDLKVASPPQSPDKKIALLDNALGDYLSGNSALLSKPGGKSGDGSVYEGHAPVGYVDILPPGRSGDSAASANSFGVLAINPRETLPYTAGISQDYAATYIGACGVSSRTPYLLASSVYAKLSPKSVANLQSGEILVLHQWGKLVDNVLPENDIAIGSNWTKPGNVVFTIYISAYSNPWVNTI
jgi:hypothetical protein